MHIRPLPPLIYLGGGSGPKAFPDQDEREDNGGTYRPGHRPRMALPPSGSEEVGLTGCAIIGSSSISLKTAVHNSSRGSEDESHLARLRASGTRRDPRTALHFQRLDHVSQRCLELEETPARWHCRRQCA
jgi:hypothetical protein